MNMTLTATESNVVFNALILMLSDSSFPSSKEKGRATLIVRDLTQHHRRRHSAKKTLEADKWEMESMMGRFDLCVCFFSRGGMTIKNSRDTITSCRHPSYDIVTSSVTSPLSTAYYYACVRGRVHICLRA